MIIFHHDPQVTFPNHTDKATTLKWTERVIWLFFLFTWINSIRSDENRLFWVRTRSSGWRLPDRNDDVNATLPTPAWVKQCFQINSTETADYNTDESFTLAQRLLSLWITEHPHRHITSNIHPPAVVVRATSTKNTELSNSNSPCWNYIIHFGVLGEKKKSFQYFWQMTNKQPLGPTRHGSAANTPHRVPPETLQRISEATRL